MTVMHALLQSVEKIGDSELKNEILCQINDLRRDLVNQQGLIETMRARLDAAGRSSAALVYDPPV